MRWLIMLWPWLSPASTGARSGRAAAISPEQARVLAAVVSVEGRAEAMAVDEQVRGDRVDVRS